MDAQRIQVKVYLAEDVERAWDSARMLGAKSALDRFIPVFHRFIRDKVFDELMIDVADYGHVHSGPGIALIGHASDYFADQSEGRFGIVYTRKREAPPPAERLADALRRALNGARLVEGEPGFGDVRFATNEILVRLQDRLHAPNDDAGFSKFAAELAPLVDKLYGASGATVEKVGTPRDPLSARILAKTAPGSVSDLLARLG